MWFISQQEIMVFYKNSAENLAVYFCLKNLVLRARSETIGYAGIFQ